MSIIDGKTHQEWGRAIAVRVADESSYNHDDKQLLEKALITAFSWCPASVIQSLIGTGIIEERYFNDD